MLSQKTEKSNELESLKVPSREAFVNRPLEQLKSLAAIGSVGALLFNPERQWAQQVDGPDPVIFRVQVTRLFTGNQRGNTPSWTESTNFWIGTSEPTVEIKDIVTAGRNPPFSHVATTKVVSTTSGLQVQVLQNNSGSAKSYLYSSADVIFHVNVYAVNTNYLVRSVSSGKLQATRTQTSRIISDGLGSLSFDGFINNAAISSTNYVLSGTARTASAQGELVFNGTSPTIPTTTNAVYKGVRYWPVDISATARIQSRTLGAWVNLDKPETATQESSANLSLNFYIIGGTRPNVYIQPAEPKAEPLVGVPFTLRALASDTDNLGPAPAIRFYRWQNATPLPDDPSRAVVTPQAVGSLPIGIFVLDNEGTAATNQLKLDVSANQVCFYVDKPTGAFDPGHSFVGLRRTGKDASSMVRGFYPPGQSGTGRAIRSFGWDRAFKDDSDHYWSYRLCHYVDNKKMAAARQFIDDFAKNTETPYHLFKYNCTSFVEELARHLGLPLPMTRETFDIPDPWPFGRAMSEAFQISNQYGGGSLERNPNPKPQEPNNKYAEILGYAATSMVLATHPLGLATISGLAFDSRQLPPLKVTAGSTISVNTPERDKNNSMSTLSWGDGTPHESQPTLSSRKFLTPGNYLVRFSVIDNFKVWTTLQPVTVEAVGATTEPPSTKSVSIPTPDWKGELEIHRFGKDKVRLIAPATGRELLIQRGARLPFGDSLPWDAFGPSSILDIKMSGDEAFFRVRQAP